MPKRKITAGNHEVGPTIIMKPHLFLLFSFFLLLIQPSQALILVGTGNGPVSDPGWPTNALEVANQKSRIGWWEGPPFGGGEWHFEYVGDATAFQQSLDAFAKIQSP